VKRESMGLEAEFPQPIKRMVEAAKARQAACGEVGIMGRKT